MFKVHECICYIYNTNINDELASFAIVKSCVTIGPIHWQQMIGPMAHAVTMD